MPLEMVLANGRPYLAQRRHKIHHAYWLVDLAVELPDFVQVFAFEGAAHAIHGGVAADVADVVAGVALAHGRDLAKVAVLRYLGALQVALRPEATTGLRLELSISSLSAID